LLVANSEALQEVGSTFLMKYGKASKGFMKIMFFFVGDIGTLGFDQL
jgi:hypothetical protein